MTCWAAPFGESSASPSASWSDRGFEYTPSPPPWFSPTPGIGPWAAAPPFLVYLGKTPLKIDERVVFQVVESNNVLVDVICAAASLSRFSFFESKRRRNERRVGGTLGRWRWIAEIDLWNLIFKNILLEWLHWWLCYDGGMVDYS